MTTPNGTPSPTPAALPPPPGHPRRSARRTTSPSRWVLPMPGSPFTNTRWAAPAQVASSTPSSVASSSARPTTSSFVRPIGLPPVVPAGSLRLFARCRLGRARRQPRDRGGRGGGGDSGGTGSARRVAPTTFLAKGAHPMNARTKPAAAAVLVALAVTAGACGSISREVARDRKIDTDVAAVNAAGVPGVSILVRQGGSTNKVASGVADVATKVPVKVDDEFRIGSVSKSFVAVVVLQLVQEHKLSLEDSVAKFLPGLVPNGDKITMRMLLNHT